MNSEPKTMNPEHRKSFCILHSAFCIAMAFAALAANAEPRVDQNAVTLTQDPQSRLVSVTYTLTGEPAVITVDFQTNAVANAATGWTTIGEINFTNTTGDVNQVVTVGEHEITWQPDKAWPDKVIKWNRFRAVVKAWATNAPPDYCAVCLLTDAQMEAKKGTDVTWDIPRRRYFASADAVPGGVTNSLYKTDFLLLRKIPAAGVVWRMGVYKSAQLHKVRLTRDYYIGIYEVTSAQRGALNGTPGTSTLPNGQQKWNDLRGSSSSYPWPDAQGNPQHNVSASAPLGVLRTRTGIDTFDFPTEAQWEYACRAGNGGWTYNQNPPSDYHSQAKDAIKAVAWCSENWATGTGYNGDSRLHPVGQKPANAWGLYDMLGNAAEWTLDWNASYFIPADANAVTNNPVGAIAGTQKVTRGGHPSTSADYIDMGNREGKAPSQAGKVSGWRVVCDAVAK